jgi:hypothetical protein
MRKEQGDCRRTHLPGSETGVIRKRAICGIAALGDRLGEHLATTRCRGQDMDCMAGFEGLQ